MKYFLLIFMLPLLLAADNAQLIGDALTNGIKVDLREPVFEGGVLSTEKGGVIEGSDIRIQARKIRYCRKKEGEETLSTIEAEGDVIVEFNKYIFIGEKLEYNFSKRSGILTCGRTAIEPWFFGGDRVYLNPDGSYRIHNAFVTTSENYKAEWGILADVAEVTDEHLLRAKNVKFTAGNVPLLKLPLFRANLNSIFDQPIRYEARAGSQGPRISIAYEVFSWNRFKTFARVDYRLTRGWGGGLENYYHSLDRLEKFESINFLARDAKSNGGHDVTIRYRFQGLYKREMPEKNISLSLTYDKLSDKEMATDYKERGLEIEAAGKTELIARKQHEFCITNFLTRARVNSFQTLKQELPTLETNIIPLAIGRSGIIAENQFKISYLDFRYSNSVLQANNDNSFFAKSRRNF
jgi:lipopolysaccharide assembly outer membrane protein LptD (OstA)